MTQRGGVIRRYGVNRGNTVTVLSVGEGKTFWVGMEQLEPKPNPDSNWNWFVEPEGIFVPVGVINWYPGEPRDADHVEDGDQDGGVLELPYKAYNDKQTDSPFSPLCHLPSGWQYIQ